MVIVPHSPNAYITVQNFPIRQPTPFFSPCVHPYTHDGGPSNTFIKRIPTSPLMRNQAAILIPRIKNNPIRARIATGIDPISAQDGVFIVGTRDGKVEALPVVVDVRVGIDVIVGGEEGIAFRLGCGDGGGVVADGAAGVEAGLAGDEIEEGRGWDGRGVGVG